MKYKLYVGQEFKNLREFCKYIEVPYNSKHPEQAKKYIGQYCKFHKKENSKSLIVDEVYDEIKSIKIYSYKYNYNIGDILKQEYGILKINDQKRIKRKSGASDRGYNVTCQICTYTFDISESNIEQGCGCSVCSHHKVLKGYNDMWTTNPELASMLLNPEDGYRYAEQSNKKLDWKCKNCNEIIYQKSPSVIKRQGLACPKCSDGISYPNKFMYNVLSQLGVTFESEKLFDWCQFKKYKSNENTYGLYDFVIENKKLILEMDSGLGHGNVLFGNKGTKQESLYKDKQKDILAKKNGYKVIRIDVDYRDMNVRKDICVNGIINSELSGIYDLNDIDWGKANTEALSSRVIESCKMKKNGMKVQEIAKFYHVSNVTIYNYLNQGKDIGILN